MDNIIIKLCTNFYIMVICRTVFLSSLFILFSCTWISVKPPGTKDRVAKIFFVQSLATRYTSQHPADRDGAHGPCSGRPKSRRPDWCSASFRILGVPEEGEGVGICWARPFVCRWAKKNVPELARLSYWATRQPQPNLSSQGRRCGTRGRHT